MSHNPFAGSEGTAASTPGWSGIQLGFLGHEQMNFAPKLGGLIPDLCDSSTTLLIPLNWAELEFHVKFARYSRSAADWRVSLLLSNQLLAMGGRGNDVTDCH